MRRDSIGQCLEVRANKWILSQTIVLFTVTKLIQYICQIEDHEVWVKNPGFLPHESPRLGQKVQENHGLIVEACQEKL